MIFDFAEVRCIFDVLKILNKGKSKYSIMFKFTKVSHTTLQSVLEELVKKKFVIKKDIGHMNVDYSISSKGIELFNVLENLRKLVV